MAGLREVAVVVVAKRRGIQRGVVKPGKPALGSAVGGSPFHLAAALFKAVAWDRSHAYRVGARKGLRNSGYPVTPRFAALQFRVNIQACKL